MSLEHSPARQQKSSKGGETREKEKWAVSPQAPVVYTINEFCAAHRTSRSKLYEEWRAGKGPRFYWKGKHRLITFEAAADYRRQREAAAAA